MKRLTRRPKLLSVPGKVGVAIALAGCSGDGPELPQWLFDMETTGVGPVAECGNGDAEDEEECDGTDLSGVTCESFGFSGIGLKCESCRFDVSGCGPPPGMVEVPSGAFEMGSSVNADEMPIRHVQVDTFWMDEAEVTVEAYGACVEADACSEPLSGDSCNWMVEGREIHPVNCVTWYQAEEYCRWVEGGTRRLPTEAEWEKAARGTDAREYPWGDHPLPSCSYVVMNGDGCDVVSTAAVGSKSLGDSPYGAHDMAGNVWEWVSDWYSSSYDAAETDNPTGPSEGTQRVLRGGSWLNPSTFVFRVAHRLEISPSYVNDGVGFRCARSPGRGAGQGGLVRR